MAADGSQSEFLTIREAANVLRVSQSTVRNAIRRGELPAYRFGSRGGTIRIAVTDLDKYVASRKTTAGSVLNSHAAASKRTPFKNLHAEKLLAAWRQQGALDDPPNGCSAQ